MMFQTLGMCLWLAAMSENVTHGSSHAQRELCRTLKTVKKLGWLLVRLFGCLLGCLVVSPRVASEDYAPVSPLGIVPLKVIGLSQGSSVDSHS